MFIPQRFGLVLKRLRGTVSQADLGARARISRGRIASFETGTRVPDQEEVSRLAAALRLEERELTRHLPHLWRAAVVPSAAWEARLRRIFHRPSRFFAGQDCNNLAHLRNAVERYPLLAGALLEKIARRPDHPQIQFLLTRYALQSDLEFLAVCRFLEGGARPALRQSPGRLGFRLHPIHGGARHGYVSDRPWPALFLELGSLRVLLFSQVPIEVKSETSAEARFRTYRLDFLACVASGRHIMWAALEIDGSGHRVGGDRLRDSQVRVPTLRFHEADVLAHDFLARVRTKLEGRQAHPVAGLPPSDPQRGQDRNPSELRQGRTA